ncbi:exonuclease domain-containing protein [Fulvivirgaceae bacterium BMA10]|uniref:Exonuclease domain-containing protein n=1 Tax=Splendidivirga corallicola TaxID=3051826 RepID=A0ABT8KXN3_9BACT|nr:exonuclease domain-containing protein [Fulvivirgaceae bacterium BMA10]
MLFVIFIFGRHMYTIIDIETTGGNSKSDKITEIAVYVHDGIQIVDEFVSLVNPERRIPYHITELTGIDNAMVEDAPKFYEVAKKIIELTEGNIFVAHNVGFDYNFIKSEFKSLGFDFSRKKLCTVKMSRMFIPGRRSYSLGKLCKDLEIPLSNRHRASGDALATVKLFEHLLALDGNKTINVKGKTLSLPSHLNSGVDQGLIKELPEVTGVYYFYNEFQEIIYIGKSKNIRSRILAHLNNFDTQKAIEMRNQIANITFEETGSELISLLKESEEIKRHKPYYNRALVKTGFSHGVYTEFLLDGYIHFKAGKLSKKMEPLAIFTSINEAKSFLRRLIDQYELCPKLMGLENTSGHCINYLMDKCKGACAGQENSDSYNERALQAIRSVEYQHYNFFIIDKGRNEKERSVVKIEKGRYGGYGFTDASIVKQGVENLRNCIQKSNDNKDIQQIINGYLKRKKVEGIITF